MGPSDAYADFIVVGGGAAGCVVARRLAEWGTASVLLLEAGPDLRADTPVELRDGWRLPKPPDWGLESEPGATSAASKLRRSRLLGGTSWLTRFAVRGSSADFDAWKACGNPGWSFDDVLPAFRKLETDAEFGDRDWHGDRGPMPITRYPLLPRSGIHRAGLEAFLANGFQAVEDHNRPGAVGFGPMPMSARDGARVTTADAYLPLSVVLPTLEVRADSPVDRVVFRGSQAVGVRLVDGQVVAADKVILAAGTYGSPSILMRSGIGPAGHLHDVGVEVSVDLPGVGENLADHPAIDLDSGWRGAGSDGPVLHSIATYQSSAAPAGGPDMMFWASDPQVSDPAFYLDPILLKPVGRGTVRLRSDDPLAPPRITLPEISEARDLERLMEGYERGLELANRAEIRRLADGDPPTTPATRHALRRRVIQNAYSIPHVVGTCRMGPSPASGDVVDPRGRVHGVSGLFVVDAAIIPDAPSGFPHIITIMVAERMVELWAR